MECNGNIGKTRYIRPYSDTAMTRYPLLLFNSYSRELEEFRPLNPRNVRLYSCGPTVYNYAHIGNLRAYIFTDTLRRTLVWKGYNVTHIVNITDVGHLTSDADEGEDKMEVSAARQQKSVWDIAEYYTAAFKSDLVRLNIRPPSLWATATAHIQEMIDFAVRLGEGGYIYELEDGVYFDTSRVPDYGKLALLDLEGQEQGKRVAGPQDKRNPADFAVWRFSPKDKQRLMEWHSPWGVGAPGWHLECSVMSIKYLGEAFDIHTGGVDHRQVHHCNEIAQNQAYTRSSDPGARVWMHNEFLILRDEKMSKSSGRFLTLQTLLDQGIHPLVYRLFALTASYRSLLEFSWENLVGTRNYLRRLLLRIEHLKSQVPDTGWSKVAAEADYSSGGSLRFILDTLAGPLSAPARAWIEPLDEALSNDLGTPQVLALFNELLDAAGLGAEEILRLVAIYDLVLGLKLLELTAQDLIIRPAAARLETAEIEGLIAERTAARQHKDFQTADRIRERLKAEGVALQDSPAGTTWEWLPTLS